MCDEDINQGEGNLMMKFIKGELCFGGRWAPKLTKGPCNSSN